MGNKKSDHRASGDGFYFQEGLLQDHAVILHLLLKAKGNKKSDRRASGDGFYFQEWLLHDHAVILFTPERRLPAPPAGPYAKKVHRTFFNTLGPVSEWGIKKRSPRQRGWFLFSGVVVTGSRSNR